MTKQKIFIISVLGFLLAFTASAAVASLTFDTHSLSSDGVLNLNPTGAPVTVNGDLTVTGGLRGTLQLAANGDPVLKDVDGNIVIKTNGNGYPFLTNSSGNGFGFVSDLPTYPVIFGPDGGEFSVIPHTSGTFIEARDSDEGNAVLLTISSPTKILSGGGTSSLNVLGFSKFDNGAIVTDGSGNLISSGVLKSGTDAAAIGMSISGGTAYLQASGTNTDIPLSISGQGTGTVQFGSGVDFGNVPITVNGNPGYSGTCDTTTHTLTIVHGIITSCN